MNIREEFVKFFESKGHVQYSSSLLVPNDPTLLFTNAGMVQFKDIFTKKIVPKDKKVVTVQTCLRAGGKHNDLDNVGYTTRHHTLFEMLGNFSFGAYFKEEVISYAWEFVTEVVKLDKEKLYVTVNEKDDDAYSFWSKKVDASRIYKFGDKDNFWQMGDVGPCGYCSEIFYDQGETFSGSQDYMGGEGDRYLEIWNLVFMEYERHNDGSLSKLSEPCIDTGMGLERMVAICEGKHSNFDSSLFMPIINKIAEITKLEYRYENSNGAHFRVIADHIRAITFLIAQKVNFSRDGRGYVVRRILRRAVRHGYLLGLKEPFMYKLCDVVIDMLKEYYPYLSDEKNRVTLEIKEEEEKFYNTINGGIELFNSEVKNLKGNIISGIVAFKLYDTFGFPLDLTMDMSRELNLSVDTLEFEHLMNEQKNRGKSSWKKSGNINLSNISKKYGVGEFVGYSNTTLETKIICLLDDEFNEVNELGGNGWVLFKETPFYPESGGQVGDSGEICGYAKISDTQKIDSINLSRVCNVTNNIKKGQSVTLSVSNDRIEITKHHSAVHIIQKALKGVLGNEITQAGSSVTKDRARFDYTYKKALTKEQINEVEKRANKMVAKATATNIVQMNINDAKAKGAVATFSEKYGDIVRVVTIGDSIELCGGCHVSNSGIIGTIIVLKESSVSSGVRRIELTCGYSAYELMSSYKNELNSAKECLKSENITGAIEKLKTKVKELTAEVKNRQKSEKLKFDSVNVGGVDIIVEKVDSSNLKELSDEVKNSYSNSAFLLYYVDTSSLKVVCGSTSKIKANIWLKEVMNKLGGKGGGRDDFAQGGTKNLKDAKSIGKIGMEVVKTLL